MVGQAEDFGRFGVAQGELGVVAQAHRKRAFAQQAGGNQHHRHTVGKAQIGQALCHGVVQMAKLWIGINSVDIRGLAFFELVQRAG